MMFYFKRFSPKSFVSLFKRFSLLLAVTGGLAAGSKVLAADGCPPMHVPDLQYNVHLFFDDKEFVDVLCLHRLSIRGGGTMHVPNDFSGPILNLVITPASIAFDLLVPKNASRPEDQMFHYQGEYFDELHKQVKGFVTDASSGAFIASFVAFAAQE
ncbi:MAG: hypothetical protein NTV34_05210 [Proteobacteria bacterium]|nr:hypothetical protein [Pseudomonadota bacterium]